MPRTNVQVSVSDDVSLDTIVSTSSKSSTRPLILLLHFWGGSNRAYTPLISHLEDDYNIIAPSLRGWGESSKPANEENYSVKDYATDISALIQHFQRHQPDLLKNGIVYAGHSMGGKIAQYLIMLSDAAVTVKGVILFAPAPLSSYMLPEEMREQQKHAYDNIQAATFVISNVLLASPESVNSKVVEELAADAVRGSTGAKQAWPSSGLLEDHEKSVTTYLKTQNSKELGPKVLLLVGELDRVETPENLELMVAQPLSKVGTDVKVELLKGVGHLIPVEAADRAASLIRTFLSEL